MSVRYLMAIKKNQHFRSSFLVICFFSLLLIYPLLSFLWRRSYPVLTSEVLLLIMAAILVGCLLSLIKLRVRAGLMALITTVVLTVVSLVQFNLNLEGFLATSIIIFIIVWKINSRIFGYGLLVILAMLVGAGLDSQQSPYSLKRTLQQSQVEPKPPIIHIILDSFIGLDGLPSYPASSVFKKEVTSFMTDFGFKVFPRAYSRYPLTGDSLYAAMNFKNDASSKFMLEAMGRKKHVLTSNRYFDGLEKMGYHFNIYQTAHLDFCQSHIKVTEKCWNYEHPNIITIRQVSGTLRRASMLSKVLTTQSFLLTKALYGVVNDPAVAVHDPQVLQAVGEDLLANADGQVYFVHLLIPHNPFVYLHDCSIRYEDNPSLSYAMLPGETDLDPDVIKYRTMRYFEQAECALLTLRDFFEQMKSKSIFDRSIILLHGDHGSQVSAHFPSPGNIQVLTIEDYRAHYSTLFAVKYPYGEFGLDNRAVPISALLREFSSDVTIYSKTPVVHVPAQTKQPGDMDDRGMFIYLKDEYGLKKVEINLFPNILDE
jgi:hypothetical protein